MGIPERKQRERLMRREEIQAAAKKVFLEKGFKGATIEDIAVEAEVSVGTIYLYFTTKEELYASLNLNTITTYEKAVTGLALRKDMEPEDKFDFAWNGLYDIFCSDPVGLRGLLHTQVEGSFNLLSPEMMVSLNKGGQSALLKLASIVREAMDEGVFSDDNEVVIADILWALFTGLVIWEGAKKMNDPKKDYLKSTLEKSLEIIKYGLVKKAK